MVAGAVVSCVVVDVGSETAAASASAWGTAATFLAVLRGARLAALRAAVFSTTGWLAATASIGNESTGGASTSAISTGGAFFGVLAFLVALRGARFAAAFFTGAMSATSVLDVSVLDVLSSLDAMWGVLP